MPPRYCDLEDTPRNTPREKKSPVADLSVRYHELLRAGVRTNGEQEEVPKSERICERT